MSAKPNAVAYDIFISYRRDEAEYVGDLAAALERAGVRCFFDMQSIEALEEFPERIREGIGRSLVLLAVWTRGYAESGHCLDEFLLAWQHARRQSSDVGRRVWVMKTEPDVSYIHAGELNAQNFLTVPVTDELDNWATTMRERVDSLRAEGPLSDEQNSVPISPRYGVPYVSKEFTGRQRELLRIHSILHPAKIGNTGAAVSVQTHGLGGIGKTELAKAYADRFAHAYPGGVWWLNLAAFEPQGSVELRSAESAWIAAIEEALSNDAPSLVDELLRDVEGKPLPANRARERIAQHLRNRGPVMWILDNVPELTPDSAREKILQLWRVPGDQGATLITTRDSRSTPGYTELPLDVLTSEDGLRLLVRYWRKVSLDRAQPEKVPPQAQLDAARWLVAHVGAHAKALTLIGSQLQSMADTDELIGIKRQIEAVGRLPRLEKIADRLATLKGESRLGIVATLVTSIHSAIGRCAQAREILAIAAVCAPSTPISIGLLRAALPTISEDDFALAMDALRGASLLGRRGQVTFPSVDIHSLVRDVTINELSIDVVSHLDKVIDLLLLRLDGAGDLTHQVRLMPDIAQARRLAEMTSTENGILLGLMLGAYHGARGDHPSARDVEQYALDIAEKMFGEHHVSTLACLNNLATTMTHLGDYEKAEHLMQTALEGRVAELGDAHPDTLKTRNNLAMIKKRRGDDVSASIQGNLEAQKQALGEEHPDTLASMLNFAATMKPRGDLLKARALEERVLQIRTRDLGREHEYTLICMNNLGSTLLLLGELAESRVLLEEALEIQRKKHGDEHPHVLITWNNLATTIQAKRELPTACSIYERLVEIKTRKLGPEHPSTLTSMMNFAHALSEAGDCSRAIDLSVSAMNSAIRTLSLLDPVRIELSNGLDVISKRCRNQTSVDGG